MKHARPFTGSYSTYLISPLTTPHVHGGCPISLAISVPPSPSRRSPRPATTSVAEQCDARLPMGSSIQWHPYLSSRCSLCRSHYTLHVCGSIPLVSRTPKLDLALPSMPRPLHARHSGWNRLSCDSTPLGDRLAGGCGTVERDARQLCHRVQQPTANPDLAQLHVRCVWGCTTPCGRGIYTITELR